MSGVKISVGGAIEDDASRRFIDARHRAEAGESFQEQHQAFESESTAAHIAEGFAQAERGELIDADEAIRILHDRRASRNIA